MLPVLAKRQWMSNREFVEPHCFPHGYFHPPIHLTDGHQDCGSDESPDYERQVGLWPPMWSWPPAAMPATSSLVCVTVNGGTPFLLRNPLRTSKRPRSLMWKAGEVASKDGRPDFGGQTAWSTLDCVLVNSMLLAPPATSTWRCLRREALPVPAPAKLHLLHRADAENGDGGTGQRHHRGHQEREVELPGPLHYPAGDPWRRDPGEVPYAVLHGAPFSGGAGAGQRLGDGPQVGAPHPDERAGQHEQHHRRSVAAHHRHRQDDGGQREARAGEGLAHARGGGAGRNPAVGEPSADDARRRRREKCQCSQNRHFGRREMALLLHIRRQPGHQEIPEVVAAEEAEETEPGGALAQNIDHARRLAVVLLNGGGPAIRHEEQPHGQP